MTAQIQRDPAVILLVEDEVGDQILTREAFQTLQTPHELRIVSNGEEALDYLFGEGSYASSPAPRPDLILLDLHLPRVGGHEVAERIHADPLLRKIPLVVLTTSCRQEDVLRAYGRGVISFIIKPPDFEQFTSAVQDLEYLVKFALAMKSLQDRRRITDRQIARLARRRQQLERLADAMFDQHMKRIEAIFQDPQADLGRAGTSVAPPAETAARAALVRLANKILRGRSPRPPRVPADSGQAARDLSHLARHLDSFAERPGALHDRSDR